jgi:phosphomevalonate kinase
LIGQQDDSGVLYCDVPAPGNYDQFTLTREENEENQMKKYKWEQEQVIHPLELNTHVSLCSITPVVPSP